MTLATGQIKTQRQLKGQSGFTLLEVLVVMLIVGVLITAVTFSIGSSESDRVKQERERFAALIALARDQTVFQSRMLGVRFVENGYMFLVASDDGKEWFAPTIKELRSRTLPKPMLLKAYREGIELDISVPEKKENEEDQEPIVPNAFLLPSGDVTPFEVEFIFPSKSVQKISFDGLGNGRVVEE